MIGKAYGIGVGPGDPELMTLKAVRIINECEVIAVPGKDPKSSVAYKIASGAVDLMKKTVIGIPSPMIKDIKAVKEIHRESAELIEQYLNDGVDVAFLTLGDPTVYSTFGYISEALKSDGFELEYINGVTSFCAAAARLGVPISEWGESVHILPAADNTDFVSELNGNLIFMKAGANLNEVIKKLGKNGRKVMMVEKCTMEDEKVYMNSDDMPSEVPYLSVVIAK